MFHLNYQNINKNFSKLEESLKLGYKKPDLSLIKELESIFIELQYLNIYYLNLYNDIYDNVEQNYKFSELSILDDEIKNISKEIKDKKEKYFSNSNIFIEKESFIQELFFINDFYNKEENNELIKNLFSLSKEYSIKKSEIINSIVDKEKNDYEISKLNLDNFKLKLKEIFKLYDQKISNSFCKNFKSITLQLILIE